MNLIFSKPFGMRILKGVARGNWGSLPRVIRSRESSLPTSTPLAAPWNLWRYSSRRA